MLLKQVIILKFSNNKNEFLFRPYLLKSVLFIINFYVYLQLNSSQKGSSNKIMVAYCTAFHGFIRACLSSVIQGSHHYILNYQSHQSNNCITKYIYYTYHVETYYLNITVPTLCNLYFFCLSFSSCEILPYINVIFLSTRSNRFLALLKCMEGAYARNLSSSTRYCLCKLLNRILQYSSISFESFVCGCSLS